jgi:hypothetical protein
MCFSFSLPLRLLSGAYEGYSGLEQSDWSVCLTTPVHLLPWLRTHGAILTASLLFHVLVFNNTQGQRSSADTEDIIRHVNKEVHPTNIECCRQTFNISVAILDVDSTIYILFYLLPASFFTLTAEFFSKLKY